MPAAPVTICGFQKWTQEGDGLPGLTSHDLLLIWDAKTLNIIQTCEWSRWARKNEASASINLNKWWEDNFKGKQTESLRFLLGQPES